jgi:hypothetical protein
MRSFFPPNFYFMVGSVVWFAGFRKHRRGRSCAGKRRGDKSIPVTGYAAGKIASNHFATKLSHGLEGPPYETWRGYRRTNPSYAGTPLVVEYSKCRAWPG